MTDMPTRELIRYTNRKTAVCGEKLLDPTIAMLLPAAYMAVTKSVGVGPVSALMAEPK